MLFVSSIYQIYKKSKEKLPPADLQRSLHAANLEESFCKKFSAKYQLIPFEKHDFKIPYIIYSEDCEYRYGILRIPPIIPIFKSFLTNNEIMLFTDLDGNLLKYVISFVFSHEDNVRYVRSPMTLCFDSECNLIYISYRYWCRHFSSDSVLNFHIKKTSTLLSDFLDELILIELFLNYNSPFLKEIFPEYHTYGAWVFDKVDILQRLELLRVAIY